MDRAPTMGFRLHVTRAPEPDAATAEPDIPAPSAPVSVFSSRGEPGTVPLREGLYLLGLTPDAWTSPAVVPGPDDAFWQHHQSLVMTVQQVSA